MRQLLEAISTRERLRAFWQRNLVTIAMLRRNLPDLKTEKGEHYAVILTSLYKYQMRVVWEEAKAYEQRARELAAAQEERPIEGNGEAEQGEQRSAQSNGEVDSKGDQPSPAAGIVSEEAGGGATKLDNPKEGHLPGTRGGESERGNRPTADAITVPQATATDRNRNDRTESWNKRQAGNGGLSHIDKTNLPISTPRRIRDKEHLRYVGSQTCTICGRSPSHAHHLRFAQPRALGRKVSDEWTVPLCLTHHRAVHSVGNEKQWWTEKRIDPVAHAVRLWRDTRCVVKS